MCQEDSAPEKSTAKFERYLSNASWPAVITFDEFYKRACYIVNHETAYAEMVIKEKKENTDVSTHQ